MFNDNLDQFVMRTFRYRVKDSVSKRLLSTFAKDVNAVWNHCNAMQRHALKHNTKWPSPADFQKSTKGSSTYLAIGAQTIQAVCEKYVVCRKSARKPTLRWRGKHALGWVPFKNQSLKIEGSTVRLNGAAIRLWLHREIAGEVKAGSFSQDAQGRWYCNIVISQRVKNAQNTEAVGIDLGLKATATLSNGEKVKNHRLYGRHEPALASAQRANKIRRVQKINAKIANARKDQLHKQTFGIASRFGFIAVGNVSGVWLQATNGKSSADAATGMFRNMLRYKAIAHGAKFVDVSEYLSTQTCSDCGTVGGPKGIAGLEIREWTCGHCGAVHDRDVNAARVILRLGRQALAEGNSHLAGARWERTSLPDAGTIEQVSTQDHQP